MEEQVNIPVLLLVFDGVTLHNVLSVFWLYASKFEGGLPGKSGKHHT